jgi:GLPGLI family protein
MNGILKMIAFLLLALSVKAQPSGQVTYERRQYYTKMLAELSYMSQADIDRQKLTWGKDDGRGMDMELAFNERLSRYQQAEAENEGGWSWKAETFILTRDYEGKQLQDQLETLGKRYVVEGEMARPKWKVLNEIKEIAGYICMKAETRDTARNRTVRAWFTDAIRSPAGPEGYWGLPGLILGLEIGDGVVVIEAKKVVLSDQPLEIAWGGKMKGKKIGYGPYNSMVNKYFKEAIEAKRNPYWNLRYW